MADQQQSEEILNVLTEIRDLLKEIRASAVLSLSAPTPPEKRIEDSTPEEMAKLLAMPIEDKGSMPIADSDEAVSKSKKRKKKT
jgi:hypothetical protein